MGCAAVKKNHDLNTKSLIVVSTQSLSMFDSMDGGKALMKRRKSSSAILPTDDFWGTMPYYVLNNRVRLLAIEIKSSKEIEEVFESIIEALTGLDERFDREEMRWINVKDRRYNWIDKYEQGRNLIKSLGLQKKDNLLLPLADVTRQNVRNKLKELKYAIKKVRGELSKVIH